MNALRISAKGQILDTSQGFKLPGGEPFSVFLRPKEVTMDTCTIIQCKLLGDGEFGSMPTSLNDWTPAAIKEIAPGGIDLSAYDAWWGAGSNVSLINK